MLFNFFSDWSFLFNFGFSLFRLIFIFFFKRIFSHYYSYFCKFPKNKVYCSQEKKNIRTVNSRIEARSWESTIYQQWLIESYWHLVLNVTDGYGFGRSPVVAVLWRSGSPPGCAFYRAFILEFTVASCVLMLMNWDIDFSFRKWKKKYQKLLWMKFELRYFLHAF